MKDQIEHRIEVKQMEQWNISRDALASLDAMDAMIRQQRSLLNNMQEEKNQSNADNMNNAEAASAMNPAFDKVGAFEAELATLFKDDEEITALLNNHQPAAPAVFAPEESEEPVRTFEKIQQTTSQTENFRQPPVAEMNNYRAPVQQMNDYRQTAPVQQETFRQQPIEENVKTVPAKSKLFGKKRESEVNVTGNNVTCNMEEKAKITEQQLRALNRKHLLMMIRDLEKELKQVKRENEIMILAYQAGFAQKTQAS